jgi:hypothetical protein
MNLDKADPRGTGWNCIVGTKFGAYVTHEIKTYAYFSVAQGTKRVKYAGKVCFIRRSPSPLLPEVCESVTEGRSPVIKTLITWLITVMTISIC